MKKFLEEVELTGVKTAGTILCNSEVGHKSNDTTRIAQRYNFRTSKDSTWLLYKLDLVLLFFLSTPLGLHVV